MDSITRCQELVPMTITQAAMMSSNIEIEIAAALGAEPVGVWFSPGRIWAPIELSINLHETQFD